MFETILLVFFVIVIWYALQGIVYFLAKIKVFFTLIDDGYAIAIMAGNKLYKMKMAYTGHHFKEDKGDDKDVLNRYTVESDLESNTVEPDPESNTPPKKESLALKVLSVILQLRNVYWLGLPPFYKIYEYPHSWVGIKMKDGAPAFVPQEEILQHILLKDYVYGLILQAVELRGAIPYDIKVNLTLQVVNPAKALFRVQRYLDASLELAHATLRDDLGSITFEDIVNKDTKLQDVLDEVMKKINKYFVQYGIVVKKIGIHTIDPDEKYREALTKKEVAKQQALAQIEVAEGDKTSEIKRAEGHAEALKLVDEQASKLSEKAMTIQGFEALKLAKGITLVSENLRNVGVLVNPNAEKPTPNP